MIWQLYIVSHRDKDRRKETVNRSWENPKYGDWWWNQVPVILNSLRGKKTLKSTLSSNRCGWWWSFFRWIAWEFSAVEHLLGIFAATRSHVRYAKILWKRSFNTVFQRMLVLSGASLGNIIIAGLSEMQGSTYNAMQLLSKFFHTTGKIYPSSSTLWHSHAVFKDGTEVAGKSADHPNWLTMFMSPTL